MLIYQLKGPNSETSLKLGKSHDVGTHFVRLEILNLNMYTILRSVDFEDDT